MVELSLVGERGLAGGLAGGPSRASSHAGDTDASAWEEIMHAHEAEVEGLRADLAAARAAGDMLTGSAEEAEALRRRVEVLQEEVRLAATRNEVRPCLPAPLCIRGPVHPGLTRVFRCHSHAISTPYCLPLQAMTTAVILYLMVFYWLPLLAGLACVPNGV